MKFMRYVQVDKLKSQFDDLIDRHAEAYLEAYQDEIKEFNSFEKSGTTGFYIGMVWTSDCEKPNINQLKIVGSQSITNNKMVEVNFSQLSSLQSFFPGQIIAFLADPFVKHNLVARRMLDPTRIAPKLKTISTEGDIRLAIACGPFMKNDQEDWTILDRIASKVKESEATHVTLVGPFVDSDNKAVSAKFDVSWKAFFDKLVEGLHDHECDVYLVPSSRDVLCSSLGSNCFYPTSELDFTCNLREGVKLKCRIKPVSDPAQIDLGGIYLDVTSAEVLFHLNRCTSFHNKEQVGGGGIFPTLYKNIITHGIYPIYPSPSDYAVDHVSLANYVGLDRLGPHIIVLPDRFNQPVSHAEDRLIVPLPKCSVKRLMYLIDIPKIESSDERQMKSVVVAGYTHKEINLAPETSQSSESATNGSSATNSVSQ